MVAGVFALLGLGGRFPENQRVVRSLKGLYCFPLRAGAALWSEGGYMPEIVFPAALVLVLLARLLAVFRRTFPGLDAFLARPATEATVTVGLFFVAVVFGLEAPEAEFSPLTARGRARKALGGQVDRLSRDGDGWCGAFCDPKEAGSVISGRRFWPPRCPPFRLLWRLDAPALHPSTSSHRLSPSAAQHRQVQGPSSLLAWGVVRKCGVGAEFAGRR